MHNFSRRITLSKQKKKNYMGESQQTASNDTNFSFIVFLKALFDKCLLNFVLKFLKLVFINLTRSFSWSSFLFCLCIFFDPVDQLFFISNSIVLACADFSLVLLEFSSCLLILEICWGL